MYKFEQIKAKDMDEILNKYEKAGWSVVCMSTIPNMTMTTNGQMLGVVFHKK